MTIARLTSASAQQTGASGSKSTVARNTTGAALLIVAVAGNGASAAPYSLSDNAGNSFGSPPVPALSKAGGSVPFLELYFFKAPLTHAAYVLTLNSAGFASASFGFVAYTGALTTGGIDQSRTGGAATASFTAGGSITPSENNELVIAIASGQSNVVSLAPNGGFTVVEEQFTAQSDWPLCIAELIQTTAAAANPTFSNGATGAGQNPVILASFKAAPGGGGGGGVGHVVGGGLTGGGGLVGSRLAARYERHASGLWVPDRRITHADLMSAQRMGR